MDSSNSSNSSSVSNSRLQLRRQCTIRPNCLLCHNEKLNQDRLYLICQECVNNIKTFMLLCECSNLSSGLSKLPKDIFMVIREYLYFETNNTKYADAIKRELKYRINDDYEY